MTATEPRNADRGILIFEGCSEFVMADTAALPGGSHSLSGISVDRVASGTDAVTERGDRRRVKGLGIWVSSATCGDIQVVKCH